MRKGRNTWVNESYWQYTSSYFKTGSHFEEQIPEEKNKDWSRDKSSCLLLDAHTMYTAWEIW